ncbi:MAG: S1 RNA-binding domain-containing protein [Acidobacteriaceae bacterium]
MPNPNSPESVSAAAGESNESNESFADLLSQFEHDHARPAGDKQLEGTVIAVSAGSAFLDIGFKSEGILPLTALRPGETLKPGDKLPVSVKGRDLDGYYELSRFKIAQPRDWSALERAFADKSTLVGTVTDVIKGGLTVDIGVRAFMPASRTATRDAAEMEKLVGQEVRCRITKLDVTGEDVVVDRRAVAEEEERVSTERRYSEMKAGDTVSGVVRSLTDYGAFIDIGGVDALLHISDIAWSRIAAPSDVLSPGQQIEARILKIDPDKRRVSVGLKQLLPQPWDSAADKYKVGERIRGTVTRVTDFGAFVELEPGIEGLIHVSEMSWAKKIRTPSDVVKPGDIVDAVILAINAADHRLSLGLKQALGDPWTTTDAAQRFAPGSVVEGPITSITKFGAFVQVAEGIEGMIHVSEIDAEKRINHPQDVLRLNQIVKAQVLEIDTVKRQLRLSMKQLIPTSRDEYIAEHHPGDTVTGRIIDIDPSTGEARVELGEGIHATCRISPQIAAPPASNAEAKADLSSLTSMLSARWKGGASTTAPQPEAPRPGQIRSFRIAALDSDAKKIEVELA